MSWLKSQTWAVFYLGISTVVLTPVKRYMSSAGVFVPPALPPVLLWCPDLQNYLVKLMPVI